MLARFASRWSSPKSRPQSTSTSTANATQPAHSASTGLGVTARAPGIAVWPVIRDADSECPTIVHYARIRGISAMTQELSTLASGLDDIRLEMARAKEKPTVEALCEATTSLLSGSDIETHCVQGFTNFDIDDGWSALPPIAWLLSRAEPWTGSGVITASQGTSAEKRRQMDMWMAVNHSGKPL